MCVTSLITWPIPITLLCIIWSSVTVMPLLLICYLAYNDCNASPLYYLVCYDRDMAFTWSAMTVTWLSPGLWLVRPPPIAWLVEADILITHLLLFLLSLYDCYSCTCPVGFDGPRCQQRRHSFDGTGWAQYPALNQCGLTAGPVSVTSIGIITKQANGLIFYNGPTTNPGRLPSLEVSTSNEPSNLTSKWNLFSV